MSLSIYHDNYQCQGPQCRGQLVLVHGWGMNSLAWDDLIPLLIEDYQVCIVDLPGFGRSPLPEGEYNLDFLVDQVLSVVPDRAIWIAWSLGGLVAQKIALEHPSRIERAFLIAATPKFVADSTWPLAMPADVFEKFQALLEEDWQGTLIRFLTLQCKGSETIKEDTRKLREYLFHYGLPANQALREGLSILGEIDLRRDLSKLSVPLHFILGEYDTLVPIGVEERLLTLSELASVHIVKGASHAAHISHPEQVRSIFENQIRKNKDAIA